MERERQAVIAGTDVEDGSARDVFLLREWRQLLACVDPHYHLAMELLLMGMIGSELEALQRRHIQCGHIQVRCAVVKDKVVHSTSSSSRKIGTARRELPLTQRLQNLLEPALAMPGSNSLVVFSNGISIPASDFVLTMKDGAHSTILPFARRSGIAVSNRLV